MNIPAHKVVGDVGKPGQIINPHYDGPSAKAEGLLSFDRYPYLKHSTADQTLADYLTRKKRYEALDTLQPLTEAPKKLTFEEWWEDAQHWAPFEEHPEKAIWKAAQENV